MAFKAVRADVDGMNVDPVRLVVDEGRLVPRERKLDQEYAYQGAHYRVFTR